MRNLNYVEKIEGKNGLSSTTELIIHKIGFGNAVLEKAVIELIRKFSGSPEDSSDVAIIHLFRSGSKEKVDLVKKAVFSKLEARE